MEGKAGKGLAAQAEAACRKWNMLPKGGRVLCALSGGRDSMALLSVLGELRETFGFALAAAHFNHHLRPGADRDEAFVRDWCQKAHIPLFCGGADVSGYARKAGRGIEDAARTLRYQFLEETAAAWGADRIATAHHRRDNAETVLLHLLRGSGLRGLGGIAPVRGRIIRPLLEAGRTDIDAYLTRRGIPFVEDETNADTSFPRNRLRLELLPLLEESFPGCTARLAAAAALLREDERFLQRQAEGLLPPAADGAVCLPDRLWREQPPPIQRRLLRGAVEALGVQPDRAALEAMASLKNGGCLQLPQGVWAFREKGALVCRRLPAPPAPMALAFGEQRWGGWHIRVSDKPGPLPEGARAAALRREKLGGRLAVGAWDGRGRLAVENGRRTIKRLFADRGIPPQARPDYPALYLDGQCVAVPGVAVDWDFQPHGGKALVVALWK